MKNHLLAITFAACLTAAQPPAPEGRFSTLCEIVPAYDLSARYTAYCDVAESRDLVSVRYDVYDGAHIPHLPISAELRAIEHSVEFVPGHHPFMRFEIPGWGQTIIYPVSLDGQAKFMVRSNRERKREVFLVSWWSSKEGEYTLTIARSHSARARLPVHRR